MKTSRMALMEHGLGRVLLRTRIGRAWWLPVLFLLATIATVQASDFSYMVNNDNTITITGYTGPGGALTIPSTINSLPVTSIGQMAFYRCASLTSVMILNGVTSIRASAFHSCTSLARVTIQDNSSGNDSAFYSYPRLASIGASAFYSCTSLTKIYFEGNAPGLGSNVFTGDNNLTV